MRWDEGRGQSIAKQAGSNERVRTNSANKKPLKNILKAGQGCSIKHEQCNKHFGDMKFSLNLVRKKLSLFLNWIHAATIKPTAIKTPTVY